jgi:hypothetical protein
MLEFKLGERVSFDSEDGRRIVGMLALQQEDGESRD